MSDPNPSAFLADALSETTRKEKRNLLVASAIGTMVATTGLVPTQLSTLGIQFSAPEQRAFITLLLTAVIYFTLVFGAYSLADFFVWRKKYQDYLIALAVQAQNWSQVDQLIYEELHENIPPAVWLYSRSKFAAFFRTGVDFVLPILIGISSAMLLVHKVVGA